MLGKLFGLHRHERIADSLFSRRNIESMRHRAPQAPKNTGFGSLWGVILRAFRASAVVLVTTWCQGGVLELLGVSPVAFLRSFGEPLGAQGRPK